jgi:hypothetical protein
MDKIDIYQYKNHKVAIGTKLPPKPKAGEVKDKAGKDKAGEVKDKPAGNEDIKLNKGDIIKLYFDKNADESNKTKDVTFSSGKDIKIKGKTESIRRFVDPINIPFIRFLTITEFTGMDKLFNPSLLLENAKITSFKGSVNGSNISCVIEIENGYRYSGLIRDINVDINSYINRGKRGNEYNKPRSIKPWLGVLKNADKIIAKWTDGKKQQMETTTTTTTTTTNETV